MKNKRTIEKKKRIRPTLTEVRQLQAELSTLREDKARLSSDLAKAQKRNRWLEERLESMNKASEVQKNNYDCLKETLDNVTNKLLEKEIEIKRLSERNLIERIFNG